MTGSADECSADESSAPRARPRAACGIQKQFQISLLSGIVGLRRRTAGTEHTQKAFLDIFFARTPGADDSSALHFRASALPSPARSSRLCFPSGAYKKSAAATKHLAVRRAAR